MRASTRVAAVGLLCLPAATAPRTCASRNVYLDLGVNWCNTARSFVSLIQVARTRPNPGPWEVFGFEASPLIQPYAEACYASLSQGNPAPKMCLPRSGSSGILQRHARALGCVGDGHWRSCTARVLAPMLEVLQPDPALSTPGEVERRLGRHYDRATRPCTSTAPPQYTLVPAAVGGANGTLELYSQRWQLVRGGARPPVRRDRLREPEQLLRVRVVDTAAWLARSFRADDMVVLKIDVEGGEWPFFARLAQLGATHLIDVLAMECHASPGRDCAALIARTQALAPGLVVLNEGGPGVGNYSDFDEPAQLEPKRIMAWGRHCLAKYGRPGAHAPRSMHYPEY